ncbi:beta-ketoacyl-ACP synthase III [Streptomyces iconiensis]|uniref:Beta-ketoacyl-[acyl-carrier-protein] synthase III n=1 Tax=Streptomyces iconiensis TaxID=1384038 RepID=A0ABT7A3C1_9ACTN|nr:beta-ketoacyl-ACP synthase III [Streptomyces iconiensis]MDJ1135809.1 beta-ketoacyl-ACP synthase III [Streptomyces iconiensis]
MSSAGPGAREALETRESHRTGCGHTAVVAGVGGWVPPRVVTNHDLSARLDTSDEWIRSRTGIARRHVIARDGATSDLAVEAGRLALKSSGTAEADAVVLATTTPDHPCPATAPEVAHRLGLGGAAAFDVAAVCTGFLYALATGQGLIAAGSAERVLVIGADAFTTLVDPQDRSTAVIFADGAGAVVLRTGDPAGDGALGRVFLGSDGSRSGLIQVPGGGSRQRAKDRSAVGGDCYFRMHGQETFRQAVDRMATASRDAVGSAGWRLRDVDRVVAHQANARILGALADELDVPPGRMLSNIEHVGNTGAASVPLLLHEAHAQGRLEAGNRLLLTAFGGGLAWGATTLVWPRLGH